MNIEISSMNQINTTTGKLVLITGATSGIGEACAEKYAAAGYNLVLTGRRADRLDSLKIRLETVFPIKVLALAFDVQDRAVVEEVIANLSPEWKQVDILINNAGLAAGRDLFEEADMNDWETMLNTNVHGLLYVTKAVVPFMIARKTGHIINLYGGGGVKPAGACTYMATKDGIRTFTRYVAEEVRDSNICVVTFSPRVPIVTETAPEEALKRLPGPDVLGNAFVLAAQLPVEKSGQCFAYDDGQLVNELPREG